MPGSTVQPVATGDGLDLSVLIALLRKTGEAAAPLGELGEMLERALPDRVCINRRGVLRRTVESLEVEMDDARFRLAADRHRLCHAFIDRVVRGVVLRTDEVDLEAWFDALGTAMFEIAEHNVATRDTLMRMLQ
jgi:hypothetical protein